MLEEAAGRICSEFVMCYPPGIPAAGAGGRGQRRDHQLYCVCKRKGMLLMTGPEDERIERLNVLREK